MVCTTLQRHKKAVCIGIGVTVLVMIASCNFGSNEVESDDLVEPERAVLVIPSPYVAEEEPEPETSVVSRPSIAEEEPVIVEEPWTNTELEAIVLTLAGECYDDKVQDKRKVCEVILNRVSSDGFPDSILDVITEPNQFDGYWLQSRLTSENDYEIAEQTLRDWYDGDCEPLSQWLFFSSGENHENVFRTEF